MNTLLAQAQPIPVVDGGGGGQPANYLGTMLRIGPGGDVGTKYSQVSQFLNLLIPLAFIVAGLILLFLLIGGGFSIIASGGNAKGVEQGKNQITGAVIGFLVIFAAYWIIQIIEKFTGVPILSGSGL